MDRQTPCFYVLCASAIITAELLYGCRSVATDLARKSGIGLPVKSGIVKPHAKDPLWSSGRNTKGYLIVDSGSLGTIEFKSEYHNSYPREGDHDGEIPVDRVAYNWNLDGYEGKPFGSFRTRGKGKFEDLDLAHPAWSNGSYRNVLIKNWHIKNAYKTRPEPHVDVTQVFDAVGWGGWFVVQDSSFKNSDDGLVQWQFGYQSNAFPMYKGKPQTEFAGVVVQGVTLKQEAGFVADAVARSKVLGTDPIVNQRNHIGSWNEPNVGWFINFKTNGWPITLQQRWEKVIVVGSLPDFFFRTGDAYAFSVAKIPHSNEPCAFECRVFVYPSIEAALAAGHQEPPFVRLSKSGWVNRGAHALSAKSLQPPRGW